MNCLNCGKELIGKQTKYCCVLCKNTFLNSNIQCYANQKKRAKKAKLYYISLLGGCCSKCGYRKNYAVLSFHHVDGSTKKFGLDGRSLSNRKESEILEELKKCVLLCANCHGELHHLDCFIKK